MRCINAQSTGCERLSATTTPRVSSTSTQLTKLLLFLFANVDGGHLEEGRLKTLVTRKCHHFPSFVNQRRVIKLFFFFLLCMNNKEYTTNDKMKITVNGTKRSQVKIKSGILKG